MNTTLLKTLYKQLCNFGLDSKEWVIRPVSKNNYLICHHADPSFQLRGQIDRQTWTQIWLESI